MLVPACTTDERARLRTIPWVTPGTGVRLVGVSDQIYFGSRDGRLHAVMPSGSNAWAKATTGLDDSPALAADETIYVGGPNATIYAFMPNGNSRWTRTTGAWIESSPAVFSPTCPRRRFTR